MGTRVLGSCIAALLVAGTASAVARAPENEPPVAVVTDPGADSAPRWQPGESAATSTSVAPTSSTAGAATRSTSRGNRSSTTTSPAAPPVAAAAAYVDQPGVWVVRPDGSGLRRVEAQCSSDWRVWLSDQQLAVVRDHTQTAFRMNLDGSTSGYPQPMVTDPRMGQQVQVHGVGSLAPDRRQMVTSYGGAAFGVAIVDLITGQATSIFSGDNPLPTWSPSGEILFVGPSSASLVGQAGVVHTTTPSPIGMDAPWLRWSPDGSRILGVSTSGSHGWVVFDPRTGASSPVPELGPGGTAEAAWATNRLLVIRETGIDHRIEPSVRTYDFATGAERVLAQAAARPATSPAAGLVAFEDARTYETIAVVRFDGTGRRDLVTVRDGLYVSPHSWSPGGDLLMFDVCQRRSSTGGLPAT